MFLFLIGPEEAGKTSGIKAAAWFVMSFAYHAILHGQIHCAFILHIQDELYQNLEYVLLSRLLECSPPVFRMFNDLRSKKTQKRRSHR